MVQLGLRSINRQNVQMMTVMLFSGRDGSRRHGEHVPGALRDGEGDASLRRREDGGSHREGRPYGRLQQVSHGNLFPGFRM